MSKYRDRLPQSESSDGFFLTDAGLETVLIFEQHVDLPEFAAFPLLKTDDGRKRLKEYSHTYINLAKKSNAAGFVLETPTWRASKDWAAKLNIDEKELKELNQLAVEEAMEARKDFDADNFPVVISGNIGPRGDGYQAGEIMTPEEAREFHQFQVEVFSSSGADLVSAVTITNANEAIGIVKAAQSRQIPCVIGFTVETDGTLPSGITLKEAIETTDMATSTGPAYYMINCAHPDHFINVFKSTNEPWMDRVQAVRANPSRLSHEELDSSPTLQPGDPVEFGRLNGQLRKVMPKLNVFGGCCGTNDKHIKQIAITMQAF